MLEGPRRSRLFLRPRRPQREKKATWWQAVRGYLWAQHLALPGLINTGVSLYKFFREEKEKAAGEGIPEGEEAAVGEGIPEGEDFSAS